MKRLRSMGAEEASTDEKIAKKKQRKPVKYSDFGAKTSRHSSKFKVLNSKFEFQASFCTTNLKYHIYEAFAKYGRRGGFHRRENSQNTVKTRFWHLLIFFEFCLFADLVWRVVYEEKALELDVCVVWSVVFELFTLLPL